MLALQAATEGELEEVITEEAEHVSSVLTTLLDYVRGLLPSLGAALLVLLVGIVLTKIVMKLIGHGFAKSNADATAVSFLQSLISVALYVLLGVIVLSVLHVPMTSIITVIGTMGIAIGLALKDSLSNVAGGFILLFSKPLKVGDLVEFGGVTGTVESIAILQTKLLRPDGTTVFIPNGKIADAMVLNYTEDPRRRLDVDFSISYEADAEKAKAIIQAILQKHPHASKEPQPLVRIGALGDSAVVLHVRVWTVHAFYWDLYYDLHEQVKAAFDEQGISFPYPQMDVHLKKEAPLSH